MSHDEGLRIVEESRFYEEPWFLHQFVATSPTQVHSHDLGNFSFENPGYSVRRHQSETSSAGFGEEQLNSIDTEYETDHTLSVESQNHIQNHVGHKLVNIENSNSVYGRVVKNRQKYAQLGVEDMGVGAPILDKELASLKQSKTSGKFDANGRDSQSFSNRQLRREYLVDETKSESTNGKFEENRSDSHYYSSGLMQKHANGGQEQSHGLRRYRHHENHQGNSARMDVDYSSQDFKRNLAAIDKAARHGTSFPTGGGMQVRQEGDTTIMTEHRDPYSFYWQLDTFKKPEESPVRLHDEITQVDNVIEEETISDNVASPDSHDSGIQVEYRKPAKPVRVMSEQFESAHLSQESPKKKLPVGWERHEDPRGFNYYWHVDSGVVQTEHPVESRPEPRSHDREVEQGHKRETADVRLRRNHHVETQAKDEPMATVVYEPQQPLIFEKAFKQTTTKRRVDNDASEQKDDVRESGTVSSSNPIRFAVRSLGWTEIAEEDLTPERSSRAVNRAIVDLSTGKNDLIDNVSKWGDGKELIMELDDRDLRLIDPDTGTLLHNQSIHQIRVWGVGRDNGRDFAYVARDRSTRRFMCHVFRCDTPARTIANTLRDICKRLMLERRPNTLQSAARRDTTLTRIDVLNEAVDRLVEQVRAERWILVDVSVAPSTITIVEVGGNQIAECRVRYLSFLGIGRDVKHCAFIMHTSSENFMCYVFHVEPSAGAIAKTIEAACKLRYQKVIDAHGSPHSNNNGKGWGDTIRDVFGSITGRRSSRGSHQHYPR